jgi:hypothetical protein
MPDTGAQGLVRSGAPHAGQADQVDEVHAGEAQDDAGPHPHRPGRPRQTHHAPAATKPPATTTPSTTSPTAPALSPVSPTAPLTSPIGDLEATPFAPTSV